jgi:hypothetical protein
MSGVLGSGDKGVSKTEGLCLMELFKGYWGI